MSCHNQSLFFELIGSTHADHAESWFEIGLREVKGTWPCLLLQETDEMTRSPRIQPLVTHVIDRSVFYTSYIVQPLSQTCSRELFLHGKPVMNTVLLIQIFKGPTGTLLASLDFLSLYRSVQQLKLKNREQNKQNQKNADLSQSSRCLSPWQLH